MGFIYLMSTVRLSTMVVMSSCLDESRSCSGVGPGGRLVSGVDSIACYLVAMSFVRDSGMSEFRVRFFRWSGDSACRSLRKYRNTVYRVVGILPAI